MYVCTIKYYVMCNVQCSGSCYTRCVMLAVAVSGSFLLESKVLPDKPYQKQEVSPYTV